MSNFENSGTIQFSSSRSTSRGLCPKNFEKRAHPTIVFLTVLLVDAKPRTFRLVKDLFSRMNESEYEVMQLKQSTV